LDSGEEWDTNDLAATLLDSGLPITVSGGEPMLQADAVADLLTALRIQQPELHIIVYSGYCVEDLLEISPVIPGVLDILNTADILVDSPFIQALDHDKVQWRGSSNQRPINLHETTWYGTDVVHLVLEDWDTQTIVIDLDGDVIGTAGTMSELFDDTAPTRMCGEVTKSDRHQAWTRGCSDHIFGRDSNPYNTEPERSAWTQGHEIDVFG